MFTTSTQHRISTKSIRISILYLLTIMLLAKLNAQIQQGTTVNFPIVSKPIQVTDNNHPHLFASYYGINSWSKNQRYITVLETDVTDRIPLATDTATLGLVDLTTMKFIPLTKTTAWNLQQGCMAHWLGTNPDSLIIYNDCRKGKFISVIMNVMTK